VPPVRRGTTTCTWWWTARYIKCLKCDAVLKWKHRDGTSGLINHAKSCVKNAAAGARNRTLTDLAGFSMLAKPDAVIRRQ